MWFGDIGQHYLWLVGIMAISALFCAGAGDPMGSCLPGVIALLVALTANLWVFCQGERGAISQAQHFHIVAVVADITGSVPRARGKRKLVMSLQLPRVTAKTV